MRRLISLLALVVSSVLSGMDITASGSTLGSATAHEYEYDQPQESPTATSPPVDDARDTGIRSLQIRCTSTTMLPASSYAYDDSDASFSAVYNFEVEGTHCYFVGTGGELVHNGCTAGGGAKIDNIAPKDRVRIQNAVNRTKVRVTVVGSRARGTPGPVSDWDYVLKGGNSRSRHSIKSSLPSGPSLGIGQPPNQDFLFGDVDMRSGQ